MQRQTPAILNRIDGFDLLPGTSLRMPSSQAVTELMAPILEWLSCEPADDPLEDLCALRAHFAALPEPATVGPAYQQCIEAFEGRAEDICDRIKPRLLNAALPLSRELHAAAADLVDGLTEVAGGLRSLAVLTAGRWRPVRRNDPDVLVARALALVHEAFLIAGLSGAVPPPGLWRCVYEIAQVGGDFVGLAAARRDSAVGEAASRLKHLLALAVLQPESLTARELVWADEYIARVADDAVLSATPLQPAASSFWIDPAADGPPIATIRNSPEAGAQLVYFSAFAMSRAVAGQVDALRERLGEVLTGGLERDGELLEPDVDGLPLGLTPSEALSLMERMRDRWASPPNRAQNRRPHQYSVQVCIGLRSIWEVVRSGETGARVAEWMVFNESPGGFAIMSVAGVTGGLTAGAPVAVRRDAAHPWSICIVRWIRSDNPEQVELGLQLIAQACTPVSIGFRGGEARSTAPALILPPVPALRRNQAVLAPSGTYASRRFVLVHEGDHLYVAQARVVSLDLQTASVELFQYEIDPYPM